MLFTTFAALCLSSSIGKRIDVAESRLRSLWLTISVNRAAVILACTGWTFLVNSPDSDPSPNGTTARWLFLVVVLLGVCEKLSAVGNTFCMERDWIPTITLHSSTGNDSPGQLTHLNAVMRRIDLVCKLVAPAAISILISYTSMRTGAFVVAGMSGFTWGLELYSARWVWQACPQLRQSKPHRSATMSESRGRTSLVSTIRIIAWRVWDDHLIQVLSYFATTVWAPSLALALLHFSALSYSATLITYLINLGFSLQLITIMRTFGSVIEISSTFFVSLSVIYLGTVRKPSAQTEDAEELLEMVIDPKREHQIGLERTGLWGMLSVT